MTEGSTPPERPRRHLLGLVAACAALLALALAFTLIRRPQAPPPAPPPAEPPPAASPSARPWPQDPMGQGLEALYHLNAPDAAVEYFRQVLADNPSHYGAAYQLAVALDRAGRLAEARAAWAKVLESANAIGDGASAETARGRIADIDRALPRPPEDPEAELMARGLDALYQKKDARAAIGYFRQVLEKNPEHYGALYQLASALDQAKKPDDARPIWKRVLKKAEAIHDEPTLARAKARLDKKP